MSRVSLSQIIYYKTKWAAEDLISYILTSWNQFVYIWHTRPLDAIGHISRPLVPFSAFFIALYIFFYRAPAQTETATPAPAKRQPRLVPRPGSQASILQSKAIQAEREKAAAEKKEPASIAKTTSMMSAPATNLNPPLSTPISPSELAKFDGSSPDGKIYVAIKGSVFDVSGKKEMYGPGASYNVFAGKDGSKGLGMSSLKPEDAVSDFSGLGDKERATLDQWYGFFEKRYNIVGKVSE